MFSDSLFIPTGTIFNFTSSTSSAGQQKKGRARQTGAFEATKKQAWLSRVKEIISLVTILHKVSLCPDQWQLIFQRSQKQTYFYLIDISNCCSHTHVFCRFSVSAQVWLKGQLIKKLRSGKVLTESTFSTQSATAEPSLSSRSPYLHHLHHQLLCCVQADAHGAWRRSSPSLASSGWWPRQCVAWSTTPPCTSCPSSGSWSDPTSFFSLLALQPTWGWEKRANKHKMNASENVPWLLLDVKITRISNHPFNRVIIILCRQKGKHQ